MTDVHPRELLQLTLPPLTEGVLGMLMHHQISERSVVGIHRELLSEQVAPEVSHSIAHGAPLAISDATPALVESENV